MLLNIVWRIIGTETRSPELDPGRKYCRRVFEAELELNTFQNNESTPTFVKHIPIYSWLLNPRRLLFVTLSNEKRQLNFRKFRLHTAYVMIDLAAVKNRRDQ